MTLMNRNELNDYFTKSRSIEFVDWEKVRGKLKVRSWRAGDRFVPLNLNGHKKISDFLTDLKVPLHKRQQVAVLECSGAIVWVIGYRLDDRFKITSQTRKILKLEKISKSV